MYYVIRISSKISGNLSLYGKTSVLHIARAMKKEAQGTEGGSYGIFNRLE